MSPELTTHPAPAHHASPWWGLRDVVIVLLVFAAVGSLAGVVWELWWTPPTGVVVDHAWVPDDAGLRELFTGTGQYVVVALVAGLLAGAACAWFVDRVALLTLVTVVLGSALGAWLMLQVGLLLAPPDPAVAARTAADGTTLPGALEVSGAGALASLPAGALTGLVVVFIGLTPAQPEPGRGSTPTR
ncbi:hypothetical protein GCM10009623_02970 [Nocardioides aestuarii]|uniref:DUF2567 domain-containing protein n=1 Tax=Nocardioides aestuarii TaxID=252231 RepID=A0ABW4TIH2_9ACTN